MSITDEVMGGQNGCHICHAWSAYCIKLSSFVIVALDVANLVLNKMLHRLTVNALRYCFVLYIKEAQKLFQLKYKTVAFSS